MSVIFTELSHRQVGDYVLISIKPSRESGGCSWAIVVATGYLSFHQTERDALAQIRKIERADRR